MPDPTDPFAQADVTRQMMASLTRRERERLNTERVLNDTPETIQAELLRLMVEIQERQAAALQADLRLLADPPTEAPPIPGAGYHNRQAETAPPTRRMRAVPPPEHYTQGLAPVLDAEARVLHDSTREPTPITAMTADDRVAWLEEKLRQARDIVTRRDAELEHVRRTVRELYAKPWLPSAHAVLEALHPYPETFGPVAGSMDPVVPA
jgi:hypothetical protein